MRKNITILVALAAMFVAGNSRGQDKLTPPFDIDNDILIAQFDLKPDPDDVHSIAALGSILTHPDYKDINVYAAAGCYGDALKNIDNYRYVNPLMDLAFGEGDDHWTDAHYERDASKTRIYNKVKPILQAGGRVWVQEGGQSDITWGWVQLLMADPDISSAELLRVVVVQHNVGPTSTNEGGTLAGVLDTFKGTGAPVTNEIFSVWSGAVTYVNVPGGNGPFKSGSTTFLEQALDASNPNAYARLLWKTVDDFIQPDWGNDTIQAGGVDFSDCIENWYILDGLGFGFASLPNEAGFFGKFIYNTPTYIPPYPELLTPNPTLEEAGYWNESGGLVVMESEKTVSPLERWKVIEEGDHYSVSGVVGQQLEFHGNATGGGGAKSPLIYYFKVNTAGTYQLAIRGRKRVEEAAGHHCNDCWVKVIGDYTAGGLVPLENLTKNEKFFINNVVDDIGGGKVDWGWNYEVEFSVDGSDRQKQPRYNFKAGETYAVTISGRSMRYNMDRLVFFMPENGSVHQYHTAPESAFFPPDPHAGSFDQENDLLVAQFDLKPDPDDLHSIAALGSILLHEDYSNINYYAAAGSYNDSLSDLADYRNANSLMEMTFGAENDNWTDVYTDRSNSIARIYNKVKPVLQGGGTVWVQEGGPSDISWHWISLLKDDLDISDAVIKTNIVMVQHNIAVNEAETSPGMIDDLKAWVTYLNIAAGEVSGNGTPGYEDVSDTYLTAALSADNSNSLARALWQEADALIQPSWGNSVLQGGGVDFSDAVADWYILGLGLNNNHGISEFWDKFVIVPLPEPIPTYPGQFVDWEFDDTGSDGTDSGNTTTDWSSTTPETATPGWIVTQLGDDPASSLVVSAAASKLVLTGRQLTENGISEAVLPFGEDLEEGSLSAGVGVNSGSTWTTARFNLVNINSGTTNTLIDFRIQRNGENAGNVITTGSTNINISGVWEDVFNDVTIDWSNGAANISVVGLATGEIHVAGCTFLTDLPPNALLIRAGASGNTKTRKLEIDRLTIQYPIPVDHTIFADWEFDNTGSGGVDSGVSATDWNVATPETAIPAWTTVQLGDDPASIFAVDPSNSQLVLTGRKSDVGTSGTSKAVLPFGANHGIGSVSADLGINAGNTWAAAKFNLVNISGGATNVLIGCTINRNGDNIGNLIATGSTNISIMGQWEDVFNNVEIVWSNGVADISVAGLAGGDIHVPGCDFLTDLPPNALLIQVGTDGDTKARSFQIDRLSVVLPLAEYVDWIAGFAEVGSSDADPDDDYDKDGIDNVSEFIAGTDPTLKSSFPHIGNAVFDSINNEFVIEWESIDGRLYDIYYSESLTGTFSRVEEDIEFPRNSHTSSVEAASSSGFYKLKIRSEK